MTNHQIAMSKWQHKLQRRWIIDLIRLNTPSRYVLRSDR